MAKDASRVQPLSMVHVLWNLLLAAIAVGLAYAMAGAMRAHRRREDRALVVPLFVVFTAWLLMLPNTAYLFTEVRHFFEAIEGGDLWSRAHVSSSARWRLAWSGGIVGMYLVAGALTFGLAVRPVRDAMRERGVRTGALMLPFCIVIAFGVYLGLAGLNSWDVLTRPERVIVDAIVALSVPRRVLFFACGGGALWTIFGIVDVWIDGARLRLGASAR